MTDPEIRDALTRKLADDGKLIEAGWAIHRHLARPTPDREAELRLAFMAGAQHTFGCIVSMLEPGDEPTDADLRRLDLIAAELEDVREELARRFPLTRDEVAAAAGEARPASPPTTLGDAPVQQQYAERMTEVARMIDRQFNGDRRGHDRTTAFILMVFPFGEGGRCNYMSNADRRDVVATLKEQIARFEGMPETKPGRA